MIGRMDRIPPARWAGLALEIPRDLSAVWVAGRIRRDPWAEWVSGIRRGLSAVWVVVPNPPGPVGGVGVGRRNGVGLLR